MPQTQPPPQTPQQPYPQSQPHAHPQGAASWQASLPGGRSGTAQRIVVQLRAAGCVFAEEEAELLLDSAADAADLERMTAERVAGQPLEHVVGWAAFCGLRIAVGPGVFVPRVRSELLVREAAALLRPGEPLVDLCCGSGALGAAVAVTVRQRAQDAGEVELHAADVDPGAVVWARRNIAALVGEAAAQRVRAGDLFDPLPEGLRGRVRVLTANAPYVPSGELPLLPAEARDHEPPTALDGGADGLEVQRRIVRAAPQWLAPGGHLLIETSERQAPATAAAFAGAGLHPRVVSDDEWDATVVIGTHRPS